MLSRLAFAFMGGFTSGAVIYGLAWLWEPPHSYQTAAHSEFEVTRIGMLFGYPRIPASAAPALGLIAVMPEHRVTAQRIANICAEHRIWAWWNSDACFYARLARRDIQTGSIK